MESWIRALKIFCIVGGVVLVAGTATLIWLLVQRQQPREARGADPPATEAIAELPLPGGLRIEQLSLDGRYALLLLRGADQQQYLALVNPMTGERLSLLRFVYEAQ